MSRRLHRSFRRPLMAVALAGFLAVCPVVLGAEPAEERAAAEGAEPSKAEARRARLDEQKAQMDARAARRAEAMLKARERLAAKRRAAEAAKPRFFIAQAQDAAPPALPPGAPPADGLDPASFYGKDSTEGVYVRDSALALEKFALAQRMERLKEWNKSADLYQEVVERYPDRVVPARTGEGDKIVQYTSVTRGVMERLARWPREGLDVYRARYEATAQSLVDAAEAAGAGGGGRGDLAEMHKVFHRYFVTDAAKNTGVRLVDINLERGEFQAAARLADELLSLHPNVDAERPALLYRAALAHRLGGDEAKAKERLAALQKDHADAIGTVRGKEVKLAESLAGELAGITSLADAGAATADSWTTLGGDATRGRVPQATGRPGARLFSVPMSKPQVRNVPAANRAQLEQVVASDNAAGMTIGVFPVVDRGELFFQDGGRVFARSVESGVALPGWAQTYPGNDDYAGTYLLPNVVGAPRTHQLTLTLTDRAVLGVMGQPDRSLLSVGVQPAGEPRLVSLDRATGRENWVVALSGIELPKDLADDQQKSIRSLQMNGAPLVVGDSVLVAARRGAQQAQFEDCWVLCFHLATGKHRWSSYVASASSAGTPWGIQMAGAESSSHLAYANGRVYALTNLGALAALDAYSGTIVWLNIYERGGAPFGEFDPFGNNGAVRFGRRRGGGGMADGQQTQTKPWVYNPVIVKDGHVFAMPLEGGHLYVYDANSGAEVKRVRRADFGDAEMLLAVLPGGRVILAESESQMSPPQARLVAIDWQRYDPTKDAASAVVWGTSSFAPLRGRPFVTADSIFIPTVERLVRFDIATVKVLERYPSKSAETWDDREEGPGNVLVTANHVLIAGASHVYGFTDLKLARARLDQEVAAAPNDTATRLRYAEVMFTAGEPATAVAKLDEAVALLGGLSAMRPGPGRDRVFNLALTFAQKLAGGAADAAVGPGGVVPPETAKLVNAMYDRAAAAAALPQQQVHYRLGRARYAEAIKDAPTAATLYQQILSQPELRPVALLDQTSGGPTQAGAVAEAAIRKLIAQAGAFVYEPFEKAAAKDFAAAQAAQAAPAGPAKPDQLLNVAETYPNSKVAPQALLAAADAYEGVGSPGQAVQVLRQMYFKYPDAPEKPRIIESMARNYLALPHRAEVAAARLAQGAALSSEPKLSKALKLPDGRQLEPGTTFAQALAEVRKYSGQAAAKNLPDFGLPVPPKYPPAAERKRNPRWPFPVAGAEMVIGDVAALALPLRDFARADRVVAWSRGAGAGGAGGKLSIYKAGEATPMGSSDALAESPKGSAWVPGDRVLVWGAGAVALVPEAGGKPAWRLELKDLAAVEVVRAGDVPAAAQPQGQALVGGGQMFRGNGPAFVLQNGQLRQLNAQPRMPVLNRPADPGAPEQVAEVRPLGDRVLVTTNTGRILSADLATGRIAWQTRLSDRGFDRVVGNEDFTVVKTGDDTTVRLIALDTVTGQIRGTKLFSSQTGLVPCNVALSADGTLVYTLPDRLVLKDLYKPWEAPEREVAGAPMGQPPYLNATAPDQLVIAEGRILALAESGNSSIGGNKKYVRVHSLETGQPLTLRVPQEGGMVDLQLVAESDSWQISLRVIGPRLYVINPQTLLCYNLDRPEEFWKGWVDEEENVPNVREVLFGQNHVVLVSQPGLLPEPRKGEYQLLGFGRYPGKPGDTAESGRRDYEPLITDAQPATHWQGVNGGFYYLTEDGKLHFLKSRE